MLLDIMNDHGALPYSRKKNTLDLLLTSLPGQFPDVHSLDKLSDYDIVAGILKVVIPPMKKPRRKVYLYQGLLTSLPGQFQDVHSLDKLSDHDIVAGTLKVVIPPIKKPQRKVYLYQKGDYESMRKDAFEFAKEKHFNGYPDTR